MDVLAGPAHTPCGSDHARSGTSFELRGARSQQVPTALKDVLLKHVTPCRNSVLDVLYIQATEQTQKFYKRTLEHRRYLTNASEAQHEFSTAACAIGAARRGRVKIFYGCVVAVVITD